MAMQAGNNFTAYRIIRSGRVHLCVDLLEVANSRDIYDLPTRPITALAEDQRGYLQPIQEVSGHGEACDR